MVEAILFGYNIFPLVYFAS